MAMAFSVVYNELAIKMKKQFVSDQFENVGYRSRKEYAKYWLYVYGEGDEVFQTAVNTGTATDILDGKLLLCLVQSKLEQSSYRCRVYDEHMKLLKSIPTPNV